MNKQELIKRIKDLPYTEGPIADTITINRNWILESIEQLDEPQKVVVPQFVADWIDKCKKEEKRFLRSLLYTPSEVNSWVDNPENQETFARAWLLGYEVEEEKRYRISMPKARNHKNHAQILCEKDGKMFWCAEWHRFRTKFTRKELEEAGFGWIFSCEGIEIEEVE